MFVEGGSQDEVPYGEEEWEALVFSYIIPFYSDDYMRLPNTLKSIYDNRKKYKIEQVLLCHNGKLSFDKSELTSYFWKGVQWVHTDERGCGAGCKIGIPFAHQKYTVLSASDLPFGFTDIESFLKSESPLALGSKAHPQSDIGQWEWRRKLYTYLFRQWRRAFLPFQTPRDSQGTVFLETALAQKIVHRCVFNNYLFSLEIISWCQKEGIDPIELPVRLENHKDKSSVSLWMDGLQMAKGVYTLAQRLKREE